jgi:hypothetical protein
MGDKYEATFHGATYAIDCGWLVEVVDEHTCGAGPGSYGGLHEPGCGTIPVARVDDLLRALSDLNAVRARVLEDCARQARELVPLTATALRLADVFDAAAQTIQDTA